MKVRIVGPEEETPEAWADLVAFVLGVRARERARKEQKKEEENAQNRKPKPEPDSA